MKNFYVFTLSKVQVVKKILASCVSLIKRVKERLRKRVKEIEC